MQVNINDLSGVALDWAVAKCEGLNEADFVEVDNLYGPVWRGPEYSTDWAQGGPIVEKGKIELGHGISVGGPFRWVGSIGMGYCTGPTPLIAAMRCFVASKFGESIEIPDELTQV